MSRRGISSTHEIEQSYHIDAPAFSFLPDCVGSRFDLTSAEPPHPKLSRILPPPKLLGLIRGGTQEDDYDFDSFTETHGDSKGEEFAIQECTNFLNRHGIPCRHEQVSLNNNILSALEVVYKKIGLSDSRKVLAITPTFGYYFKQFKELGIGVETLETTAENNFLPNPEELEKTIVGSGAVALLLCYPNNPTGTVMTEECARQISEIAERNNIFVISDEAFMNNSLSEVVHFPVAAIPGMLERSFTVTSAAKSMFAGQKTGFCVSRPDIISGFARLGGYPTKQSQKIMTAALEDSAENHKYLAKCRDYYLGNIDVVQSKLTELNTKFRTQFSEEIDYVKPFISRPDATNVYLLDFSGLRGKKYGYQIMATGLDTSRSICWYGSGGVFSF